jgi:hypothetical protein
MSEAAIVLATLFALAMIGVGLALFVKGAHDRSDPPSSWPNWPPTKLS